MKKIAFPFFLLMLPMLFTACEKTDDGSHVDPITLYEKLPGTWELTSLKLVDELARANMLEPYEFEIRTRYGFSAYAITFHIDSSYLPTSYEVVSEAPELFPVSGYWELEHPFVNTDGTPTLMNLYADEAKTQVTDQLSLTTLPGRRAELEFRLTRMDGETPYVSYVYKFRLED